MYTKWNAGLVGGLVGHHNDIAGVELWRRFRHEYALARTVEGRHDLTSEVMNEKEAL
jgi:hypothetical protein